MQQQQPHQQPQLQLPTAVLALILRRVPQRQRLKLGLVNSQWAAAARMGTLRIKSILATARLPNLSAWLQKHGRQLQYLGVSAPPSGLMPGSLQLPCAQLQQLSSLKLYGHMPQLSPGASNGTSMLLLPKLVALELHNCTLNSSTTLMQLTAMSSLTSVDIRGVNMADRSAQSKAEFSAAVGALFRHLTQLQQARLGGLNADEPTAWCLPSSIRCLVVTDGHADADAAAGALLAAVGRMRLLETLELSRWQSPSALRHLPPHHFSALTFSSQLRQVDVSCAGPWLPAEAVSHMFPGKLLRHLTSLCLATVREAADEDLMSAGELQRLVTSCPTLRELDLRRVVQPGDLSPLLALTSQCTSLTLGGRAVDDAAASIVCWLTQLQHLRVDYSSRLTDIGLERLTALTALTSLSVVNCMGCSREVVPPQHGGWNENELLLSNDEVCEYGDTNQPWRGYSCACNSCWLCGGRGAESDYRE